MCGAGVLGIQCDFIILLQKNRGVGGRITGACLRETRQAPPRSAPACHPVSAEDGEGHLQGDEKQPAWQSCTDDDVCYSTPLGVGMVCYAAIDN